MALREAPFLRRVPLHGQLGRWLPLAISPTRLVLAIIVAAFVLAMIWVQQTQSLVRVGGELQRLEQRLELVELERQNLLAEIAVLNNLPSVQRIAFTSLGMRAPEAPVFVRKGSLPAGVTFDLPLWAAPTAPLAETPWWEAFLRELSATITALRE